MQPKSTLERIEELERKVDRLKVSYEKYFRGLERREPWPERHEVERRIRDFLRDPPRTTAARFRLANLRQRLTSLETYWNRIARQIEEGTYERDREKARRRLGTSAASRAGGAAARGAGHELEELDLDALDMETLFADALTSVSAREEAASPPPPKAGPPPPPKAGPPAPPKVGPPAPPKVGPPAPPKAGPPAPPKAGPPPPPKPK